MYGIEHYDIVPDGIILGKSVGAGLTLGAFMARDEIMDCLPAPAHLFTLGGNALACSAGIAAFDYMQTEEFQNILKTNCDILQESFAMLKEKHGDIISTTNGLGMSCGIGIVKTNADGTKEPDLDGTFKILYRAYEKGLLVISVAGNILRISTTICSVKLLQSWMKLWLIMKQAISLTTYCSSRMAGNIDITREKQFMLLSFLLL